LLEYAAERTPLHAAHSPRRGPYLGAAAGYPGCNWTYGVTRKETRVHLWIERGVGWEQWNDAVYRALLSRKEQIEDQMGPIEWDAKPGNRSRKLIVNLGDGGWETPDLWDEAIRSTVSCMIKLVDVVTPFLELALDSEEVRALSVGQIRA
jgi:hypothetical protein